MLYTQTTARGKRQQLRAALASGKLLRFPGAFSPLIARLIEAQGWEGVYVSGGALAADLGLPDIGLTTLDEVSGRSGQIARMTNLPVLIDADTGFGEPLNAARTVQTLEAVGVSGCHLEDQQNPKRCGHLANKTLVDTRDMVQKLQAACAARRDENFLLMARTDARAVEGLTKAIDRAKAYVDAGADAIFPEALASEAEFEAFRKAVDVPLLANMTEFGKSPLLSTATLESLGYNLVIYPVTGLRLAMQAVETGFSALKTQGVQSDLIDQMQTRKRLYQLLDYDAYRVFDEAIAETGLD